MIMRWKQNFKNIHSLTKQSNAGMSHKVTGNPPVTNVSGTSKKINWIETDIKKLQYKVKTIINIWKTQETRIKHAFGVI